MDENKQEQPKSYVFVAFADVGSVVLTAQFESVTPLQVLALAQYLELKGKSALMEEENRREIDPYVNCILCGICFGTCPAFKKDPKFLGPAMLAKTYRFLVDPRDKRNEDILKAVNSQQGVWGCKTVFNCVKVCPKQVPPTHGIVKMRGKILGYRIGHLLSRFSSLFRS